MAARWAPGVPAFPARTEVVAILDDRGDRVDPRDLPPGTTVAVAGLARPGAFAATLASLGIVPASFLEFPDHARYGAARLGRIEKAAEESGATALVTTEKDAVKLEGRLALPLFRVAVEMSAGSTGFTSALLSRLQRPPA